MGPANQEHLSLGRALERIRALAADGDWAPAERLCAEIFAQLPPHLLSAIAQPWVGLLRAQQRHGDACRVLHRYLQRVRWFDAGSQPAPVLLVYGLDNVARGDVLFEDRPGALAFSANGGHFDATQLLKHADFAVDRLFVDSTMTADELRNAKQRLQHYALVVNTIADPGSESPALQVAAALLEGAGCPVVNPPSAVLPTSRDQVARRLDGVPGLRVPGVARLEHPDRAALLQRMAAHPGGIIVRPIDSQTGIGVQRVRDQDGLDRWLAAASPGPVYVTDFHDFASPDGFYRKFRVFAIGGRLWPEHMISSTGWNIHSADRRVAMQASPSLRAGEEAFLADPRRFLGADAWAALEAAAARMGLDYCGIDFARVGPEVLLFEANPAMRLNFDHCERFPYLRPHLEAVSRAFCARLAIMAGLPAESSSRIPQTQAVPARAGTGSRSDTEGRS